MATAYRDIADRMLPSESCMVDAAPVPGVIGATADALGPVGTAVASAVVVPLPSVGPA